MVRQLESKLHMITGWLLALPRSKKRLLMLAADGLCIPLVFVASLLVVSGWSALNPIHLFDGIVALLVAIPIFVRLGLYRAVIRYLNSRALWTVLTGVSSSVLFLFVLNVFAGSEAHLPFSVLAVYWAFALIYVMGSRFIARDLLLNRGSAVLEKVIIYGAGSAGVGLKMSIRKLGRHHVVGFIDDDSALQKSLIKGLEVFPPARIPDLIKNYGVTTVLVALPSVSRSRRKQIIQSLGSLGLRVQVMPDVADLISGDVGIQDLRDVDVADLLGRDPVAPNVELLSSCIRDKVVMVTGAGGSIGSELCRQIIRLKPSRLLLFEISEAALYQIDQELKLLIGQLKSETELVALLGNAHHRHRVREVLTAYGVQTVYHAAAYKHVPIVEQNIVEGIHNNVFSAWHAAEAANDANVEVFVLISTDKAVNPTNVMGASKRLAEIVLQSLQDRGSRTRFCIVRFGNVLDSSGSVVPLFRKQIKRGGPVTVTHRDIIRYFMTIPEASQLVIQAASMARGGEVFVLDMGDPVRIYDLAVQMIRLMGCTVRDNDNPQGDIEIQFTGLRPAEKLYEELLIGNNVSGTDHPKILRAAEHYLSWPVVANLLQGLLDALSDSDCERLSALLKSAVREYRPESGLEDLVWSQKNTAPISSDNVAELSLMRSRQ